MDLTQNYFELFGIPVAFEIDREALAARYRELQAETHPDRFASDPGKQAAATRKAARINDAYARIERAQRPA